MKNKYIFWHVSRSFETIWNLPLSSITHEYRKCSFGILYKMIHTGVILPDVEINDLLRSR